MVDFELPQFTGELRDSTGLTYLRARYYASPTARFITSDTRVGDPQAPLTLNRFLYANGNPITNIDPSGRWICTLSSLIFNPDCKEWVDDALGQLEQAPVIGPNIADFFHQRDEKLKVLGLLGVCALPPLAPFLWGIKIEFTPLVRGGMAFPPPDVIFLDSNRYGGKKTASPVEVALFAHEISHLEQQPFRFISIQSEVLSYLLEYQLEKELGTTAHNPYSEFIFDNHLDPWKDANLEQFRTEFQNVYGWFPLRPFGGDLPRDWLDQWGTKLPSSPPPQTKKHTPQ